MSRNASLITVLASSLILAACGGPSGEGAPAAAPSSAPAETPASSAASPVSAGTGAPSAGPSSDEPQNPTGAQKRPLDITSQCEHPVAYFVGDDPKAGPATAKRAVDPLQVLPVERRRDGSQTVWLLDEKSEPLVKVSITRGMKKIEVGKSCRTLDAR